MASWQSAVLRAITGGLYLFIDRMPLEQLRYARAGGAAAAARRAGVGYAETRLPGPGPEVRALWFTPPGVTAGPVLLYFHGGGWTLGFSEVHYHFLAALSRRLGWRLLAVDYRLAPEHPFPAGLEDCLAAYRWLIAGGQPAGQIVMGGDSAGGNFMLAALLALKQAGQPLPAAGLGLSPAVDLSWPIPEVVRDPLLTRRFAERLYACYITPAVDPAHPLISPLHGDLAGLPPLLLQMGEIEFLRASAEAFAAKARAAGVNVTLEVAPGMWHVWPLFGAFLPEAETAIQSQLAFARRHVAAPA